jgi:hypothetical protein
MARRGNRHAILGVMARDKMARHAAGQFRGTAKGNSRSD